MSDTPLIKGDPPAYRHPPYQGGQGGSAPPLSRGSPPPIGTPLIKGEPPAYRHPPYQGGAPRLSAPPLSRGAGGIEPKIYLQFNYNQLLKLNAGFDFWPLVAGFVAIPRDCEFPPDDEREHLDRRELT